MTAHESLKIKLQDETLTVTSEFLEKYNVPGPRYTSYPTAPEWNDDFGPSDFVEGLERSNASRPARPLSLYMHLPFCESLCLFCGCNVVINKDHQVSHPYLEKLKLEADRTSELLDPDRPVVQFHWGGGTPTYFTAEQLEELFVHVKKRFLFAPDAEIGLEVDPRVTTLEQIRILSKLGFNRISLGIQDFTPIVQETVRRMQPFEATRDLIDECRRLGYESINVDLIYGLPHQTPDSFADSIEKVLTIRPDRVAMFSYAHVPWLKKQQGSFEKFIPRGMEKFRIFVAGIERFTEAGYFYIGMDHFALAEDELHQAQQDRTLHRNFQGYTTKAGADLLGMGVSSISGLDRVYAQNFRDLQHYYAALDGESIATMRGFGLSDEDVLRRAVINKILCHCVLEKHEVGDEFGVEFDDHFARELCALENLERDGLVELSKDRVSVTALGRIFIRNVGMVFDTYLRGPREKPLFSKTL